MDSTEFAEWPNEIAWVYVICNPKREKERFERLVPHLIMRGIPKERLRMCGPTWADELDNETIFKVYDPYLRRGNLPTFTYKSERLSKGEISLMLNFFTAMQNLKTDLSGNKAVLILESDAYLRRDFVPRLVQSLNHAKANGNGDWDFMSLGEGVGLRPADAPNSLYAEQKTYAPNGPWMTRCADAMLFRGDFLNRMARTYLPLKECLDWELNFQGLLHKAKALWVHPPLAEQGTTRNRYDTHLK